MMSILSEAAKTASSHPMMPTVALGEQTEQQYYAIARLLMQIDYRVLDLLDLEHNSSLFIWIYAALVFAISWAIGLLVQWIVVDISRLLARHIANDVYAKLREQKFFTKICRILPALVFAIFIQFTLSYKATLSTWLTRFCWVYVVIVLAISLSALSQAVWSHVNERNNTRKLPLRGLIQLVKGIIWILCTIIVVGILCNKSPGSLLAGLGAFAAVLMLVFKDSILGLVAGVQLSENDSLHVGDWIKVPGTDANGIVQEVTLTTVKVLNWDKTTTSLPPYSLVSGSFTNYRSMQQSNSREISRAYFIDADSIVPTTDAMLDEYEKIPLLTDWIKKKREEKAAGHTQDAARVDGVVAGSIESNLGVFRAYMKIFLDQSPLVDHRPESECFVSTLAQTPSGVPLRIYCFTSTSAWVAYESIQSAIFEHIAVMLYHFGLYSFENPSGRDTILDGYLSPGKNPDVLFGLPYPFYNASGTPQNPAYPAQTSVDPQPNSMKTS